MFRWGFPPGYGGVVVNALLRLLLIVILCLSTASIGSSQAQAASIRTQAYAKATDVLNLRTGPGTGYTVIRVIPSGARVYVYSGPHNTSWYKVGYGGSTGYSHGAYLAPGYLTTVYKLGTTRKVVALTFDAGADTGYAREILDTLKSRGVKATFGITGKWAEANPALVRRMVDEGHSLINHTYSHRSFTGRSSETRALTYQERSDELWKTQSIVARIASGNTRPYFRPPYGDFDNSVLADVWSRGYTYNVMWSTDSLGWKGLTRQQIVQRVMNGAQPGAIYLFHVGAQAQDGPALPEIISKLRAQGYSFATVSAYYK